jgi:hypothetical protein
MTEGILQLFVLLVLVGAATIVVLALALRPERLQARIFLPWNAGILIDTQQSGKGRRPPRVITRPEGRESRAWLAAKILGRRDWEYGLDPRRHTYVGCSRDMDIILKDPAADKRHAVIYWKRGRYHINNLSKKRGTRVNGRPITTQRLGNGNKIRMGNTELIFREQR